MTNDQRRHPGGRTLREVVSFALLVFVGVFALITMTGIAVAGASTTHSASAGSARSCSETSTDVITNPQEAFVEWNTNTCGHQIRVEVQCENPVSEFTVTEFGGWVRAIGLHSAVSCSNQFPNTPTLTAAFEQRRNGPGSPISTHQFFSGN